MAKYYREPKGKVGGKQQRSFGSRLLEGIVVCTAIGIALLIARSLITTIPLAMLAIGIGALAAGLFLRASMKAFAYAVVCAGCAGLLLLSLTPFAANVYLFRGYRAAVADRWDRAIAEYQKATQYDSKDGELNFYMGYAYMKRKDYEEAAERFNKSLETKLDPSAFNNVGNVYLEQGKFKAAEEAYRNALYTRVSRMYSYNNLGAIYQKTGRLRKSLQMFEKAVEASPNYEVAKKNMQVVENMLDKYSYALERYGEDFLEHFFTAQSLMEKGHQEEALEEFLAAKEQLVTLDSPLEAGSEEWSQVRQHLPQMAPMYSAVGSNLVRLGRLEDAVQLYETTAKLQPGNVKELYRYISSLYEKLGQEEKAQETLEKLQALP